MSYLHNQGICRGAPRTEEILTEGEIETVKRYLQERDMVLESIRFIQLFKTHFNQNTPFFSLYGNQPWLHTIVLPATMTLLQTHQK
jgi:hypothetical protein